MDISEFTQVGAKIVELGIKLKELRSHRSDVDVEISDKEKELQPLIVAHTQFLAEFAGQAFAPIAPTPVSRAPNAPPGYVTEVSPAGVPIVKGYQGSPNQTNMVRAEQQVRAYLEKNQDDPREVFPMKISEDLKIDYAVVRTLMAKIIPTLNPPGGPTDDE